MKIGGFTIGQIIVILTIIFLFYVIAAPGISKAVNTFKSNSFDIKRNSVLKSYDKCLNKYNEECSSIKFLLKKDYLKKDSFNCKDNCFKNPIKEEYWDNCYVSNSDIICNKKADAYKKISKSMSLDKDGNLRYSGKNPPNFVLFNGDKPKMVTIYRIINEKRLPSKYYWYEFTTLDECYEAYNKYLDYHKKNNYYCQDDTSVASGWRIIGIINIGDKKNKDTRIKLIKTDPIGTYSFNKENTSDWSKSILMTELNGDYLNTSLLGNKTWYNGQTNDKRMSFDYTMILNKESQNLIDKVKWHKGNNWTGKVGLPYVSDYVSASATASVNYHKNNYLFTSTSMWFLNQKDNKVYALNKLKIKPRDVHSAYNVRPVVYLKKNVSIIKGNGTVASPYIFIN